MGCANRGEGVGTSSPANWSWIMGIWADLDRADIADLGSFVSSGGGIARVGGDRFVAASAGGRFCGGC